MSLSNFLEIDTTALFQQVPSEQEWIPEGHLARFVLEMVLQMDLTDFVYSGSGSKAYPPATVMAMLIYGYLTGIFSSRKIETARIAWSESRNLRLCPRTQRPCKKWRIA